MTGNDWITIGLTALVLLILIEFFSLKVWVAVVVFGGGFWFATTPVGVKILAQVTRILASISH